MSFPFTSVMSWGYLLLKTGFYIIYILQGWSMNWNPEMTDMEYPKSFFLLANCVLTVPIFF